MIRHRNRTLLSLSLAGVAVLAITACGDSGEDAGAADTAESAEGDSAEPSVEDVPALSEVEGPMWEAMLDAESVSVSVQGMDLEGVPEDAEQLGLDLSRFTVTGAVQGSGVAVTFGEEDSPAMLAFEDAGYVDAGMAFTLVEDMFGGQVDVEGLREEIDGRWMEFTDDSGSGGEDDGAPDVESMLEDLRDGWDSSEAEDQDEDPDGVSREGLSEEGAHDVREGEDVWVYAAEEGPGELVLQADHETPYMRQAAEGEQNVTFEQWDEAEVPERPEGEELITEEEIDELVTESLMEQM